MNKTELLSIYTAEQLADMVIVAMESKEDSEKLIEIIASAGKDLGKQLDEKQSEIEKLQSEVEKYRKVFEDAKKECDCQIAELKEYTDSLKCSVDRKQDTINQIDSIICELFGVTHYGDIYSEDFKELLKEKSAVGKTVYDFLPTEPIKVADMLIHNYKQGLYPVYSKDNKGQIQNIEVDGKIYPLETGEYEEYSELRQIAEHLLVYCNHNGEVGECKIDVL